MNGSEKLYLKYGWPEPSIFERQNIQVWRVPDRFLSINAPRKIYCHKDLPEHLEKAFQNVLDFGFRLPNYDGCYIFRPIRGYEKKYRQLVESGQTGTAARYLSIHSWGMAIDFDAYNNALGYTYQQLIDMGRNPMGYEIIDAFKMAGFTAGADFKRPDRMHFEYTK